MAQSIEGLQAAQDANARMIAALRPNDALGRAVQYAVTQAHRGVVSRTHVGRYAHGNRVIGGGSLRASQQMRVSGLEGAVYSDPRATNPITGRHPALYEQYEDARGGDHAAKQNTVAQDGAQILDNAADTFLRGLP